MIIKTFIEPPIENNNYLVIDEISREAVLIDCSGYILENIKPVLEEGIKDGSIKIPFAKELAEVISLLANVWLNPLVFSMSDEDIEKKCQVILGMMSMLGVDVTDMYPAVYNMNKQINEMDNRK